MKSCQKHTYTEPCPICHETSADNVLRSAHLRANYILGQCRGEEEMRAEARAIVERIELFWANTAAEARTP